MKTHKTVTVTKRMLCKRLYACDSGVEDVESFLPAKISTDPEQNIKLATKLVEAGIGYRAMFIVDTVAYDSSLYIRRGFSDPADNEPSLNQEMGYRWYEDVYVMAQGLAAGADALLTAKGR